jgi:hypothetical protein
VRVRSGQWRPARHGWHQLLIRPALTRAHHTLSHTQAFLVAALCEEWVKLRLARRALHFEVAMTPTSLLLHAAAASAAFASLENVFYLNFRAVDADGSVSLATLFIRCVLGVPSHVAYGVASAAGLALHHFGGLLPTAGAVVPPLTWSALGRMLWPSVMVHGLWDFLIFLDANLSTVLLARCSRVLAAASQTDAPSSTTTSSDSSDEALANAYELCGALDAQAAGLMVSIIALRICCLVAVFLLPVVAVYICRRRVLKVRALEVVGEPASANGEGAAFLAPAVHENDTALAGENTEGAAFPAPAQQDERGGANANAVYVSRDARA